MRTIFCHVFVIDSILVLNLFTATSVAELITETPNHSWIIINTDTRVTVYIHGWKLSPIVSDACEWTPGGQFTSMDRNRSP